MRKEAATNGRVGRAWKAAVARGHDLSVVEEALRKSPAERCRVLGLDALIKAKETMGRPRDRAAVEQLKAIRERQRTARQSVSANPT